MVAVAVAPSASVTVTVAEPVTTPSAEPPFYAVRVSVAVPE